VGIKSHTLPIDNADDHDSCLGTSHPTIKSPEQGLSVLSRFAADFQYPAAHEGHERIISLKPRDHTSPVYSRSEIAAILQHVHDSPPVTSSFQSFRGRHSFRGNSFRGHPVRSDFGPGYVRMPRGRSDAVDESMNKVWQTVPGRTTSDLRTSRMQANNGHFIDPGGSPRTMANCSHSHVAVVDGYGGTGTAEDPFTLS
jgi:hypothetical protein